MYHIINVPMTSLYCSPYGEKTDEVLYGMTVHILEKRGKWNYVKTEYEYEGWLLDELQNQIQQREVWMEEFPKMVVTAAWIDILLHPSIHSKIMITVPRGSILFWMGEKEGGKWYCVRLCDGRYGWIREEGVRFWEKKEQDSIKKQEKWIRKQIIEDAKTYKNTMYRWGGKTPFGVDCSGFCSMVYWINGIVIYRDAKLKEEFPVKLITREQLLPGDLLYYPGHIALYLGEENYIHASQTAAKVVINSLDASKEIYRADLACPQVGSIFC
ncbi:MAG: C40 family peptidase [Clostridiales bacterium]|nr:C40 family peptidase [Clostridiales bacterium]